MNGCIKYSSPFRSKCLLVFRISSLCIEHKVHAYHIHNQGGHVHCALQPDSLFYSFHEFSSRKREGQRAKYPPPPPQPGRGDLPIQAKDSQNAMRKFLWHLPNTTPHTHTHIPIDNTSA